MREPVIDVEDLSITRSYLHFEPTRLDNSLESLLITRYAYNVVQYAWSVVNFMIIIEITLAFMSTPISTSCSPVHFHGQIVICSRCAGPMMLCWDSCHRNLVPGNRAPYHSQSYSWPC